MQEAARIDLPPYMTVASEKFRTDYRHRLQIMPRGDALQLQCYGMPNAQLRWDALENFKNENPGYSLEIEDIEADVSLATEVARELLTAGGRVFGDGRVYEVGAEPDHLTGEPWIIEPGTIENIYAVLAPKSHGMINTTFYSQFPFENGTPSLFSEIGFSITTFQGQRLLAFLKRSIAEEFHRKTVFRPHSSCDTLLRLVLSELVPPQNILMNTRYS